MLIGSYKSLNPRWLLLGEGAISDTPSTTIKESTLFQFANEVEAPKTPISSVSANKNPEKEVYNQISDSLIDKTKSSVNSNQPVEINITQSMSDLVNTSIDNKEVERIVLFFKDKTFVAYTPSK